MEISKVREDFPLLQKTVNGRRLVYLDNAATTQLPIQVTDCIREQYACYNGNVHRGAHRLSDLSTSRMERARALVAAFIGAASPNTIVFTSGTTAAVNMLATAYCRQYLQPGDEILLTCMEHHSNYLPWYEACRARGAALKTLPMDDAGNLQLSLLPAMLSDRTKLVAAAHVSNVLGTVNPIAEIVAVAHARGIPVLVDGAQAMREIAVDVQALDVDFYCFSGHKMLAPTGIGVLYAKETWLEALQPVSFGGGMVQDLRDGKFILEEYPLRFEAGTPNYVGAIALGRAIEYIDELGRDDLIARERHLTGLLAEALAATKGIQLLPGGSERAGCVGFFPENAHPYDVAMLLDSMGIAVRAGRHCAMPLHAVLGIPGSVRVSPAFYNTEQELYDFRDALERVLALASGKES